MVCQTKISTAVFKIINPKGPEFIAKRWLGCYSSSPLGWPVGRKAVSLL